MTSFFARPVRLFGSVAVLVLCVVFFLTPFALRGARMSLQKMENNVKDWLPSDFPETQELEWFGQHFVGERFVLVTWPGAREGEDRFELLLRKLQTEVLIEDEERALALLADGDSPADMQQAAERLRARRIADRLGLFATGNYYENWGGRGERWLLGESQQWYFLTPQGGLYRWDGKSNLPGALYRVVERLIRGENKTSGELIAELGQPGLPQRPNEFFADPRKVTARFFKTVETGPKLLEELTVPGGPLWPRMSNVADEDKRAVARKEALDRLTGTLFGPAVQPGFSWSPDDFYDRLPEETRDRLPADWREQFVQFVDRLVQQDYDGELDALRTASAHQQSIHWDEFFVKLRIPPPPRQTSIIVTLSEPGKRDLAKVIGRPILGKPPGKLIDLAVNECGVPVEDLKLGGPPVDNMAIDEEGTVTLFRLIGFSAALGIGLSYLCFRSLKVTTMVFFVGGVSAVTSLSIVWWGGASVDAVLMSMPSLVYVLGLSGAIHIVNYYREAVEHHGLAGAPERALSHGWGPCTLAAFTTALGLISLYSSNLAPIKKFGLFSAIGVMATLALLFTYLPAALQIWPPGYHKREGLQAGTGLAKRVESFWLNTANFVLRRHGLVTFACLVLMVVVGLGLQKINTSVQLLKLFDSDAKIIRDYEWLEANFGKLVPMELVIRVQPEMMQPAISELEDASEEVKQAARFQLNFLERMELAARVQSWVETVFGEDGQDIVGQGLSAATFAPELPPPSFPTARNPLRWGFNTELEQSREQILASDYLRLDQHPAYRGSELWRVSLRLGALNDVDYGEFVHEQKLVVEPILQAYEERTQILQQLATARGEGFVGARVGILGVSNPVAPASVDMSQSAEAGEGVEDQLAAAARRSGSIDQTYIFASTLEDLLTIAGCRLGWIDPGAPDLPDGYFNSDAFARALASTDCVVLAEDHPELDLDFVRQHARLLVDARDHEFDLNSPEMITAAQSAADIQVVYTGVVPVVYKAQRTLLNSLIESIGMAFVMIAVAMMILLRDWKARLHPLNLANVRGGLLSMLPNVFPVVIIFGAMGHAGILVDIGTMMCASVAMGVAVDDTIHFLSWFRHGIRQGRSRHDAILDAYRRVATAMTQTTLIGGLGLAVFAFSTFTPTQRFGTMMVTLLFAALIGDLIFLPALLAGPAGRWFCPKPLKNLHPHRQDEGMGEDAPADDNDLPRGETRHSPPSGRRADVGHTWPR